MKKRMIRWLVLAAFGASSLWAHAQNSTLANYVVAVVNNQPITSQHVRARADLLRYLGRMPAQGVSQAELLNELIDEQVLLQQARLLRVELSERELDQALLSLAKGNGMSLEQLKKQLESVPISWPAFEQVMSNQMIIDKLRQQQIAQNVRVSPAEVLDALDKLTAESTQVRLHLAQILVKVPEGASQDQWLVFERQVQELRRKLMAGQDFAELAKQASESPEAVQGGDLGERSMKDWPPLFVRAVAQIKPGEVSEPVRSGAGWHLIKLLSQTQTQNYPSYTQTLARHILLSVNTAQARNQAEAFLQTVRGNILRGELSFASAATQYSQDNSAVNGGSLGWADPGVFVPSFEAVMNALKIGEVSEPVQTQFGVHLIQVEQRREMNMSEAQVKAWLEGQLKEKKAPRYLQDWLHGLRAGAYIDFREAPP